MVRGIGDGKRLFALLNQGRNLFALVVAQPDRILDEVPVAFVTVSTGHDAAAIVDAALATCTAQLADFKVPRVIRLVTEIPKGPTGKLQRIGLADRLGITTSDEPSPAEPGDYVAPRTPLERRLADLWGAVLKVERPGVNDHFLDLGGDSMLAALLVARIREELRVEIPIRSLFDAPTVAEQARVVEPFLREAS